jgi:hypothetical protein
MRPRMCSSVSDWLIVLPHAALTESATPAGAKSLTASHSELAKPRERHRRPPREHRPDRYPAQRRGCSSHPVVGAPAVAATAAAEYSAPVPAAPAGRRRRPAPRRANAASRRPSATRTQAAAGGGFSRGSARAGCRDAAALACHGQRSASQLGPARCSSSSMATVAAGAPALLVLHQSGSATSDRSECCGLKSAPPSPWSTSARGLRGSLASPPSSITSTRPAASRRRGRAQLRLMFATGDASAASCTGGPWGR